MMLCIGGFVITSNDPWNRSRLSVIIAWCDSSFLRCKTSTEVHWFVHRLNRVSRPLQEMCILRCQDEWEVHEGLSSSS